MQLQCFSLNPYSELSVTKNADGHYVISTPNAADPLVIDTALYRPQQKYTIFLSEIGQWYVMEDEWMNRSRDAWAFAYYQLMIRQTALANVYFHDSFDNSVLFMNRDVTCDLPEMEELNRPVWLHDHFAEMFPEADAYLRGNVKAKHDLMIKTNTIDSIVALENQLDLLTDVVKSLIAGEAAPEWASEFINGTLAQTSVRDVADTVTKTVSYKTELRENVNTYLSAKQ
jgi:hypothetical protein